jgi:hypothetical protein
VPSLSKSLDKHLLVFCRTGLLLGARLPCVHSLLDRLQQHMLLHALRLFAYFCDETKVISVRRFTRSFLAQAAPSPTDSCLTQSLFSCYRQSTSERAKGRKAEQKGFVRFLTDFRLPNQFQNSHKLESPSERFQIFAAAASSHTLRCLCLLHNPKLTF